MDEAQSETPRLDLSPGSPTGCLRARSPAMNARRVHHQPHEQNEQPPQLRSARP